VSEEREVEPGVWGSCACGACRVLPASARMLKAREKKEAEDARDD